MGASLYRTVRSRIRIIVEHLLELEYSPAGEPRDGWKRMVMIQRLDLEDDLTPSLRPRIEASLDRLYAGGRLEAESALRAHGEHAAADALPPTCPYTLDQITATGCPD